MLAIATDDGIQRSQTEASSGFLTDDMASHDVIDMHDFTKESLASSLDLDQSKKTLETDEPLDTLVAKDHPRHFADWKWKGIIASVFVTSVINGRCFVTQLQILN